MADTPVASNNKPIAFGAKAEGEMAGKRMNAEHQPVNGKPPKSKKPAMHKAAKRAMKRGMISEKAAKRHFGGV